MSYGDIVGFADVDFARTPFFGRYFGWVERAWEACLHESGIWYGDMVGVRGLGVPVVGLTCDYLKPLWLDDHFSVEFRVTELTRKGLAAEFRFVRRSDAAVTCRGTFRRRFVDMGAFRGCELPDDLYARFEELAADLRDWPPSPGPQSTTGRPVAG